MLKDKQLTFLGLLRLCLIVATLFNHNRWTLGVYDAIIISFFFDPRWVVRHYVHQTLIIFIWLTIEATGCRPLFLHPNHAALTNGYVVFFHFRLELRVKFVIRSLVGEFCNCLHSALSGFLC